GSLFCAVQFPVPVAAYLHIMPRQQKGEIHAAGLDVFEQEPLSVDSPLLSMANVVAVPHIGSATHETRYGIAACAVDNLIDALQGKVEKNCVNPHVAD
ncbi:NAD(P)-dependent oxidoreductase, partial [Escherichia sp. R-CC3]